LCTTVATIFTVYKFQEHEAKPHTINTLRAIINPDGSPSPTLNELLMLFNLQHDGSLGSIVQTTQKNFLRPAGKERWEMEDIFAKHSKGVFPMLKKLGLVERVIPSAAQYDYGLLLGATHKRMLARLHALGELWKQGVRFKHLVLLGSERPLDPTIESHALLMHPESSTLVRAEWQPSTDIIVKTEMDALKLAYDQVDIPSDMRAVEVIVCNTPMIQNPDGTTRRANTGDTINTWLATNPKPGSCLCISSQPYVGYQDAVVRVYMPTSFSIDTVGNEAQETNIAVYLDSLARWLYNEKEAYSLVH
jgi:hypothetical protein